MAVEGREWHPQNLLCTRTENTNGMMTIKAVENVAEVKPTSVSSITWQIKNDTHNIYVTTKSWLSYASPILFPYILLNYLSDITCKSPYVVHCAIWYHLYNLKNVKNTHGGNHKSRKVSHIHYYGEYTTNVLVLPEISNKDFDGKGFYCSSLSQNFSQPGVILVSLLLTLNIFHTSF